MSDLYRGEGWFVVREVLDAARRAQFDPELLVASAGLGLRSASSMAPGYAATFAAGQADTVSDTSADARGWWHSLRAAPGALQPSAALRGRVLLVLSNAYAAAMHCDLVALGHRGDDVLMIGGAVNVQGITRLAADRGLRTALGGTMTGLTMRMAQSWLEGLDGTTLASPARLQRWRTWTEGVRQDETWERQRLTDDQLLQFIREARSADPSLSRTKALRTLRDSGRACEQSRFAQLYRTAVAER
ncbi:MAG TPA: hypothetical protein VGD67_23175 [Pseudonocardiaceae bacterium]